MKNAVFFALLVLTQYSYGKPIAEGNILMNGDDLKAVLYDDLALKPECKKIQEDAKGAMFYLNGKGFGSGCWILLGNEVHALITSYDTNQSKAYVFSLGVFSFSNESMKNDQGNDDKSSASTPPVFKNEISLECKEAYQARVFNYFLENVCQFSGGVSETLGTAAHKVCDGQMNEREREMLSDEVKTQVKIDIESNGQQKFCDTNEAGYILLVE